MDPAMLIEVAAMSRQKAMEEAIARGDSEIQKFYCNSTVFITGGSGFMGKQFVEKLFRSCQMTKVFLLLRPKKGKKIQERLDLILQDPVFITLRKQQPDFEQKLIAIEGDVAEIKLGLSDQDWETITKEVDVIYHMAATTRFDETLRLATLNNVRGTREALILGRACRKLKSYVHVSTAYAQGRLSLVNQEVYEKFYTSPVPPDILISMAETMDVDRFNSITDSMIQDWPNTYTFTKAVAEELVRSMTDSLPISIVRPGIVVAAYREPSPGWLDMSCAYGASGLVLLIGLGLVQVMHQVADSTFGLIPCDFVNNAIIAAGKEASHSSGGENTKIYVVSSVARNTLTQGAFTNTIRSCKAEVQTPKAVYYTDVLSTGNNMVYILLTWLLHFIPAYIMDFGCSIFGKERRFVKIYTKIYNLGTALSCFTTKDWMFVDKNLENLHKSLSKTDKAIFNFDITSLNWIEYTKVWCIGIRKYIIKDGLTGTKDAVKKQFWFRILNYFVCAVYFYIIWKLFCVFCYVGSGILSVIH